ncbi:hypothetical protein LI328DRAFT_22642 [Trichoderma asperelloides]|nr:hypothetical protein LI328DRAFT_22642 [Trichoderma asperelloides]
MDTRTDYSVFRTVRFTRHQDRSAAHPGSTILQVLLPVRRAMHYCSWINHHGPPWTWLMQLNQRMSLAATAAKDGANHRSLAPLCNPAHLTRSIAGAPAQLRRSSAVQALLRNILLCLSRCIDRSL